MSDLEYRAWDKVGRKMIYFGDIGLIQEAGWGGKNPKIQLYFTAPYDHRDMSMKMSDLEIMQYTGLKDIDGNRLFRGDVFLMFDLTENSINGYRVIDFHNGAFGYWLEDWGFISFAQNTNFKWEDGRSEHIKKVGNVFDNPELAREAKSNE